MARREEVGGRLNVFGQYAGEVNFEGISFCLPLGVGWRSGGRVDWRVGEHVYS